MKIPVMSKILTIPIGLLILALAQKPSLAWLKIRNNTPKTIYVAIGYKMDPILDCGGCGVGPYNCKKYCPPWLAKGWWKIEPGSEAKVLGRDLSYNNTYYYYASTSDNRGEWSGDVTFCVSTNSFVSGRTTDNYTCPGEDYRPEKFQEIRTEGHKNFTLILY